MKANAPEKIYLNPLLMEDGESIVRRCTFERQRDSQVEYTRTDAFIEKVSKWLKDCATFTDIYGKKRIDKEMYKSTFEDFVNYMKGE